MFPKFSVPVLLLFSIMLALTQISGNSQDELYQYGPATPDGTGKYYFQREISQVMGHRGAGWLERPDRAREEKPSRLIKALDLKSGQVVADIGAGTGYFSRRMAEKVGPEGVVYAVDIQPEMLEILERNLEKIKVQNVRPVLGTLTDPELHPESIDLALMVDVYHEFSHPYEMLQAITRALKPGGRVVFVEYRAEDGTIPIKPLHKMSETQVLREAAPHGLIHLETVNSLPRQHIIIFKKPNPLITD